ncbi:SURF1 family cytochrome oxidase biogenesis protein [Streptomyces sp. 4N509B]|uniref:SURF1 family cytochrome oxidase biogenesis protein n=1 Tax=Streptomyces sp. 4N509B TaxID=3457413 RepID=UPI003FD3F5F7
MYRFLLTRQWVILTLVALLLIPTMVWLGFWQLNRHEQRVARNELIAASLEARPVPMAELTEVGGTLDPDHRYRPVTATGEYDADGEVLARQRTGSEGGMGYFVLTPLVTDDGTGVLVNRGWVPAGTDPTVAPPVASPPSGTVTVTGRLMSDETTGTTGIRDRAGLPEGMVMLVSSQQRSQELGLPMLGGYLELTDTSPAGGRKGAGAVPEPLPEPDHTGIGTHFAYAVQWWIFAAGVPVGWALLVRRELGDRRQGGRPTPGGPAGPGQEEGPGGPRDPRGTPGAAAPEPEGAPEPGSARGPDVDAGAEAEAEREPERDASPSASASV